MNADDPLAARVRRAAMFEQTLLDAPDWFMGVQAYVTSGDTLTRCAIGLSADPDRPLISQVRFRTYRLDPANGRMRIERSGTDDWPDYDPGDERGSGLHLLALAKAYALVNAAHHRRTGGRPVHVDAAGMCGGDGGLHIESPLPDGRPIPAWRRAVAAWTRDLADRDPRRLRSIMFDTTLHILGSRRSADTSLLARADGPDLYVLATGDNGLCRLGHYYYDREAARMLDPDTPIDQARDQIIPLCDIRQSMTPRDADRLGTADRMIDAYISQKGGTRLEVDLLAEPTTAPHERGAIRDADDVRAPSIAAEVASWIIGPDAAVDDRHGHADGRAAGGRPESRAAYARPGAARTRATDDGRAIIHQQRRSDIMMTQQVMRGNLASDPKYWPATTTADGRRRQAYGEAMIYRNRRIQLKDGSYADSPKGPEKIAVKFWGRDAELMHQADFKSGDPVVAAGSIGEPDAYTDREGKPTARSVINGDSMCMDSMRIAAGQQAADARAAAATATVQQTYGDGFAAPTPTPAANRTM